MKKLLPLLLLLAVFSCEKDASKKDLLSRSWKINTITVLIPGGTNSLITPATCDLDETWIYTNDGGFLMEPSPSCALVTVDNAVRGKWTLSNKILWIKPAEPTAFFPNFEFQIITLTKSKLVMRRVQSGGGGGGSFGGGSGSPRELEYEFVSK